MTKTKIDARDLQDRASRMVQNEVICCMSSIVATLAKAYTGNGSSDVENLAEEAFELCCPVADYEEAAIQEGWTGPHTDKYGATYFEDTKDKQTWACASWKDLCREFDIEPYDREVFEHWAVSNWLADKLTARGEKVLDFDNFKVWARCTTGQAISIDGVIEDITREIMEA